jgi:hypothetical protein
MQQETKTSALTDTRQVALFIGLSALASLLPFMIHLQYITGPIVNAILIISLFVVGIRGAILICLIPSLMALSGGLLPAVLAPTVPFIMISNIILVLCVEYACKYAKNEQAGFWTGVFIGAAAKFLFLYFSVSLISELLLKQEFAARVAQMMSWPQFATAFAGGIIAWAVLRWLKRI